MQQFNDAFQILILVTAYLTMGYSHLTMFELAARVTPEIKIKKGYKVYAGFIILLWPFHLLMWLFS